MVDRLKGVIAETCPYCGGKMINLCNEFGKITNRRCENYTTCPGHNAAKAEDMFKILGVQGIGYKTCLDYLRSNGYKSHLDCLPLSTENELYLYDIFRLLCIDGLDKQWKKECETVNVYTLEDVNKLSPKLQVYVNNNMDTINKILEYIKIKVPSKKFSDTFNNIMITGPVNGFVNKNDFINYCNDKYGEYIKTIHQENKRKTNVDYLIKEPQTAPRAKVEVAKSAGIPIVSSEEYLKILEEACKQFKNT